MAARQMNFPFWRVERHQVISHIKMPIFKKIVLKMIFSGSDGPQRGAGEGASLKKIWRNSTKVSPHLETMRKLSTYSGPYKFQQNFPSHIVSYYYHYYSHVVTIASWKIPPKRQIKCHSRPSLSSPVAAKRYVIFQFFFNFPARLLRLCVKTMFFFCCSWKTRQ